MIAVVLSLLNVSRVLSAQGDVAMGLGANTPKEFWRAAGGVTAINTTVWAFDRYVKRESWARVGTRSWGANLRRGFEWDDDRFQANQFAHPYHGSQYFGVARANGYDFWAAIPFTGAGSLMWELFGETKPPSLNDLINTTLGGIALGELTHRMALRVRAGAPSGHAGLGRRIGAFMLNPGTGLGSGRQYESGAEEIAAAVWRQRLTSGYRWGGASLDRAPGARDPMLAMRVEGGNAFDSVAGRPYDVFDFTIELAGGERTVVTRAQVGGLLRRHFVRQTDRSQLMIVVRQDYDYFNTTRYEWGGQTVGGGVLYRRTLNDGIELHAGTRLRATVLGGISSDHATSSGRTYDYGPGVGLTVTGALRRGEYELVKIERTATWLHSVNGADADHIATLTTVSLQVPAFGLFGVGAETMIFARTSRYAGQPRVRQEVPQLRVYGMFGLL